MCATQQFLRRAHNISAAALDARYLSITDAWGYYRGLLLPPNGEPGSTEWPRDVPTSGIEGMHTSGGRNLDTSGDGQDTSDGNLDTGDESQDTGGEGLDTSGYGVVEACNIPNSIDPRRDKVR